MAHLSKEGYPLRNLPKKQNSQLRSNARNPRRMALAGRGPTTLACLLAYEDAGYTKLKKAS